MLFNYRHSKVLDAVEDQIAVASATAHSEVHHKKELSKISTLSPCSFKKKGENKLKSKNNRVVCNDSDCGSDSKIN